MRIDSISKTDKTDCGTALMMSSTAYVWKDQQTLDLFLEESADNSYFSLGNAASLAVPSLKANHQLYEVNCKDAYIKDSIITPPSNIEFTKHKLNLPWGQLFGD